ncbi:MAG: ribonuclease HI [Rikenellaceae bacterium]
MDKVTIYTDGSSRGNPGNGGFGVVLMCGPHRKELSGGYRTTTNNRMELLAVISGLEALKRPCEVMIYSDSKYVIDSIEKGWIWGWLKKDFAGKKNKDLWLRYLAASKTHTVKFVWVKGHSGDQNNERCDFLATSAADSNNLLVDSQYEQENI